ncbi:hypothetical protein Dimus_035963, partial [Dionaea muscipula]
IPLSPILLGNRRRSASKDNCRRSAIDLRNPCLANFGVKSPLFSVSCSRRVKDEHTIPYELFNMPRLKSSSGVSNDNKCLTSYGPLCSRRNEHCNSQGS